jgi:hypothetical protein
VELPRDARPLGLDCLPRPLFSFGFEPRGLFLERLLIAAARIDGLAEDRDAGPDDEGDDGGGEGEVSQPVPQEE